MSPSKILFFICLAFIFGIGVQSFVKIPQIFVWGFLFAGVLIIFLAVIARLLKKPKQSQPLFNSPSLGLLRRFAPRNDEKVSDVLLVVGFCFLFLVLGILRMQIAEFNVANNKLSKLNDGPDKITLTGVIYDEPSVRDASQKLKVKVDGSIVLVTTGKYPEYHYLDKVKITGKLETPMETEDFSYKNYLLPQGIYSVMNFVKIEVLGKEKPNFWEAIYSGVLWFKQKMRASLQKYFLPPEEPILQGIILGDSSAISTDLKNKLSVTGVSHIIAVSGTHVVILTAILMAILISLGLCRGQAFYFAAVLICLYIVLVGMPASGVRAGIMGIIFLLGQKLGRQANSARIIVIACAAMLLQNPLLLIYDIGFQLSFLAVLALICIEPFLRNSLKFLIKKIFSFDIKEKYDGYIMLLSATLSAQIFTLPIITFNFGNISFVSPVANILILPITEYIMVFGFLSAFLGAIFFWLGWIFSVPCYLFTAYFVFVVNFLSKPWAYKMVQNVHWGWLAVYYFLLAVAVRYLRKKTAAF